MVAVAHRLLLMIPVLALSAGCAAREPRIMTWTEYARVREAWPHVLRFEPRRGALLYFGARHTHAVDDPQVERIERLWTSFAPTIAFNEGGDPPVAPTRDAAVAQYSEAGLVRFLAARDDVPCMSLDPTPGDEFAHLRRSFAAADVKLFFVARAVAQHVDRAGRDDAAAECDRVLRILNARPGLGTTPASTAEVETALHERFPDLASVGDVRLAWFDPTRTETVFNRVSRESNEYRDRAIVAVLARAVHDGQRVFAVVGGTHVVMQEGALAGLLRTAAIRVSGS